MSELEGEEYSAFRALAKDASEKDIISLLKLADEQPEMVDHIRAILSVSMPLNKGVFTKIKEAGIMPEALKTIYKEEFQKERAEGRAEGRNEGRQEVYERMIASNIPEEQARKIAFG